MSPPPKYASTVDEEEESVGLLPPNQHAYPPSAAAVSSSLDGAAARSVVYILRPEYPVTEVVPAQNAVSALGKSREETVQLVFEAFSDLQQIDESRLEFFVPSDPTGPARHEIGHYARITGPAWAGLSASVVRIGIKDAPGEKERRRRRDSIQGWRVVGVIIALMVGFIIFAIYLYVVDGPKKAAQGVKMPGAAASQR